jgi:hypothetical protein
MFAGGIEHAGDAGNGASFRWPVFKRPLVAGFQRPLT